MAKVESRPKVVEELIKNIKMLIHKEIKDVDGFERMIGKTNFADNITVSEWVEQLEKTICSIC